MRVSRIFVLDTNTLIEANNRYYGFDICPGFWFTLLEQHNSGRLHSIDRVKTELLRQEDDLPVWVRDQAPATFFHPTATPETVEKYSQLMTWAFAHPAFFPGAKNEFATNADAWLIAHAAVNGLVVVTQEQYSATAKRRIMIPNVCLEFNVECVDTYSMLRDLGVSFSRI